VRDVFARLTALFSPIFLGLVTATAPALAHSRHHQWVRHWSGRPVAQHHVAWGSPTDPNKDAALILDGETGRVLYSRNAYAERHPASLTKMMTLYLLFDALKHGQLTMNSPIYVSSHAASQQPTKLAVSAGNTVPVDIVIRSLVVLSANDMAVAVAEALGGTESHFAELMTQKAHDLGMRDTFYHNASGLPDNRQITTASDLGILARHLAYDFPQYFRYFSLPGFSYAGRVHLTHDNLIGRYAGADGIKTGYTSGSGFNLVSSVVRNGAHVIGIVMGGYSAHRRDMEMVRLLDQTFVQIAGNPTLVAHNDVPWRGTTNNVQVASLSGFPLSSSDVNGAQGTQYASLPPRGQEMDEDAAESASDTDEIGNIILSAPKPQIGPPPAARQPAPAPAQAPVVASAPSPPKPQPNIAIASAASDKAIPSVVPSPRPKPNALLASIPAVEPIPREDAARIVLAAYHPDFVPMVTPTPRGGLAGDGRVASLRPTMSPGASAASIAHSAQASSNVQGWTIQIGAFADMPSARAQLAAYAERSMDILGQAARIIIPFQGVDGKTLYRARFGPFPEQEARAVCATLTNRGQTCFAATMASR